MDGAGTIRVAEGQVERLLRTLRDRLTEKLCGVDPYTIEEADSYTLC